MINEGKVIETGAVKDLLSGQDSYNLQVDSPANVRELIDKLDWAEADPGSDGMINVKLSGGSSAQLNRLLVEQGIEVSALVPVKTSLEDLYLKLVGENDA